MASDAQIDLGEPLVPADPRGAIEWLRSGFAEQSDEFLTWNLQACIERMRHALNSLAPGTNIADAFEGAEAATAALILKERHG